MLDSRQLEPALTEQEQLLRDHFVNEYLKDFNKLQAALRLGFLPSFAVNWSEKLFNDGYVQRKINYFLRKPADDPMQEEIDRALVENTLRKVMEQGSDSARVAAAGKFMALKGWDKAADIGDASEDLVETFKRVAQQLPS
jgi:hypothetical protein